MQKKKARVTARVIKKKGRKLYLCEESQNDGIIIPDSVAVFTNIFRINDLQLKQGEAVELMVRKIEE